MIGLSLRLGEGFEQADTPETMAETLLKHRAKGGTRHE